MVDVEIGYLRALPAITPRLHAMIGAGLEENFTYTPAIIYPGTINYASLLTKGQVGYSLNNGKTLVFGFAIPVITLVTRMPYHNLPPFPDKTNLQALFTGNDEVETVNNFQNFSLSVRYNRYAGRKISVDVIPETSWLHYNKPEHLTRVRSQLSLGINF